MVASRPFSRLLLTALSVAVILEHDEPIGVALTDTAGLSASSILILSPTAPRSKMAVFTASGDFERVSEFCRLSSAKLRVDI